MTHSSAIPILSLTILCLTATACSTDSDRPRPSNDFLLPLSNAPAPLANLRAILHRTGDEYTISLNNPNPYPLALSLNLRIGDTVTQISPPGYLLAYRTETLKVSLPGKPQPTLQNNRLIPTINGDPLSLEPHLADPTTIQPSP